MQRRTKSIFLPKIHPHNEYILKFDGCSKGNPGPSGAGAVIYQNNSEIWACCQFVGMAKTNNQAEYYGLILGLEQALQDNIKNLSVCGDSQLVIKHMTGEYKVKSSSLSHLYIRAKELASQFACIDFSHIYRNENVRADELSNLAVSMISNISLDKAVHPEDFYKIIKKDTNMLT